MHFFLSVFLFCCSCAFSDHFLTFIIPCYNCEKWIEESVESVFKQNVLCPFELICTDDGSADGTYSVLCALKEKHPEMIVLQHEKNRGGGAARNTCVAASRGDIIFCLDSDNVLEVNSVQRLIDRMDETGAEVVSFGSVYYFTEHFNRVGTVDYKAPFGYYDLQFFLLKGTTPPCSGNYLYTRASFDQAGGYPEKYGALDTYAFGFYQLLNGCKMSYVPGTYYWHRHGIDSYFIRESGARKIDRCFFELILANRDVFDDFTISRIQANEECMKKNQRYLSFVEILESGLLRVKNYVPSM
jgi:glycosyltransferase involved in cell wall biosynthesis